MSFYNVTRHGNLQSSRRRRIAPAACLYSVLGLGMTMDITASLFADEFFNPAFLSDDPASVADLSRFEKGEGQAPGNYRVEIYLNDEYVSSQDITFTVRQQQSNTGDDDSDLDACISPGYLNKLNVNIQEVLWLKKNPLTKCVNLPQIIPGATTRFDFEKQRLYISIPQAALKSKVRGYIPPEEWDEGINALLVNYNFTGSNTRTGYLSGAQSSYFLSLNSGINLAAWRLRNYSTWNYSNGNRGNKNQWQNISTYVQRTLVPLRSQLTLGDSYTPGDIFDGIGFRGGQIASDDNMLPDSQRGFAPTVRGVASGNAMVTIRQNGYVIYQTYVSPGAFEITDLYPTSNSGDLHVTVAESNGTENTFSVPYSAVPMLLREGRIKYTLTAGQYRSNHIHQSRPSFGQGTLTWGLRGGITVYGGTQLARNFRALAMGSGVNLGQWGALSADVTQANSILADDSRHQGQSLRFLYAKSLNAFGTNFQLLGYRFSTQGFYTLNETSYHRMSGYTVDTSDNSRVRVEPTYLDYYNLSYAKKGRVQINITQQLGATGSVFLTGSRETYWRNPQPNDLWMGGYNASWNDISCSLTYSYNKNSGFNDTDRRLAVNVSLPLGKWLSHGGKGADITSTSDTAYATYAANTDMHGHMTQQAGVSGTLLADNNLSYSVQQGHVNHGDGGSGNASLSYQGGYGNSNIGYNYSKGYRQATYGLSGGVVGHANGITLSQPLGDTNVLVKAPGASGVNLENTTGVSTDWRGYAVMPYATTYRNNRIALNTTTLKDNADLDESVVNVVPMLGALVRAEFITRIGARALLTVLQANGKPVPFGATVAREDGSGGSIVGDNGQVYLSGLPMEGSLAAKWGNGVNQSCLARYRLGKESEQKDIHYKQVQCQ